MSWHVLPTDLFAFLLIFARIGAAMVLLPGVGEAGVPPRLRLLFALGMSAVLLPALGPTLPRMPADVGGLGLVLGTEIVIGAFLGTVARLVMAALEVTGMVIGYQSALSNALFPDPSTTQGGAFASGFLMVLGLVLVFATDLHHVLFRGLAGSYALFEPGEVPPLGEMAEAVTRVVSRSFLLGVQLAAPFILVGLVFSLGSGLLSRLMPQIQVFFIVMPVQISLGFVVLLSTISGVMLWFLDAFAETVSGALFSG